MLVLTEEAYTRATESSPNGNGDGDVAALAGHTGVYPGSDRRRPYVQWGGESFVFPCTEVLV
jgi:hypothetical protein